MKHHFLFLLSIVLSSAPVFSEEKPNPFFAMNTIARGRPAVVVPMLKELGYDGLGGSAGDGAMAKALAAEGLKFFNGYTTLQFHAEHPGLTDDLRKQIDAMADHDTTLWIALAKVFKDGMPFPKSSPEADRIAVEQLREIAGYASSRNVRLALYPHTNMWIERVEDAIRVADKLDRPDVGVTFNLCHWLKVEGSERDPGPVLQAAMPRLMFVTINGADTGGTQQMGWDRLIQPLDRGSYDLAAFVKKLRAAVFTGPVGFQGYGIKEDPRDVLARTMAAWKKLMPELAR